VVVEALRESMISWKSYSKSISNLLAAATVAAGTGGPTGGAGGAGGEAEAIAPGVLGAGDIVLRTWNVAHPQMCPD
jgi:hypothetical protein